MTREEQYREAIGKVQPVIMAGVRPGADLFKHMADVQHTCELFTFKGTYFDALPPIICADGIAAKKFSGNLQWKVVTRPDFSTIGEMRQWTANRAVVNPGWILKSDADCRHFEPLPKYNGYGLRDDEFEIRMFAGLQFAVLQSVDIFGVCDRQPNSKISVLNGFKSHQGLNVRNYYIKNLVAFRKGVRLNYSCADFLEDLYCVLDASKRGLRIAEYCQLLQCYRQSGSNRTNSQEEKWQQQMKLHYATFGESLVHSFWKGKSSHNNAEGADVHYGISEEEDDMAQKASIRMTPEEINRIPTMTVTDIVNAYNEAHPGETKATRSGIYQYLKRNNLNPKAGRSIAPVSGGNSTDLAEFNRQFNALLLEVLSLREYKANAVRLLSQLGK